MKIISKNIEDTEKIAKDFLNKILAFPKQATLVALYGNLGAGKTTFTQSLGKHLGIKRKVNSPTFVIMKKYLIKNNKHKNLIHIDAYRLKNEKDLENLGWAEIISNPDNLIFIEWPENVPKALPKKHHKIKISHTKESYRSFEIK
ncbi:MAG: tRNA (adenosine(37)-N6)-threonylcarbamoyltransferase complex ATPase subunit type 1 TsaE [Candidatus Nomurabacteria bacterium]|nr:tRNA (adenosine(37)-N6)-threonylcarbamoyltransferase complex ATPase subunit type 1 TsaE [Candidatus Nomurabacteria bacterium]